MLAHLCDGAQGLEYPPPHFTSKSECSESTQSVEEATHELNAGMAEAVLVVKECLLFSIEKSNVVFNTQ